MKWQFHGRNCERAADGQLAIDDGTNTGGDEWIHYSTNDSRKALDMVRLYYYSSNHTAEFTHAAHVMRTLLQRSKVHV